MANEFKIKRGFISEGDGTITGSLQVTGTVSGSFSGDGSALNNITASLAPDYTLTSSFNSFTSSYTQDSSSFDTRITNNSSSLFTFSGSYIQDSASFDTRILNNSSSIYAVSSSFETFTQTYNTGSFTGSFIGDLQGTASNAISASNSISSSYAGFSISSSYAEFSGEFRPGSISGSFGITIDGGGSTLTTGEKGFLIVPYGGTITGWTVIADQPGNCVIDVWKTSSGNIPTVANTITGTEKPTLSSQQIASDLTLTSWTTSVNIGDVVAFNVDSASTITRVNLSIYITKQ